MTHIVRTHTHTHTQVAPEHEATVQQAYEAAGVPCSVIGSSTDSGTVCVSVDGAVAIKGTTPALRDVWEATSFELERRQVGADWLTMCCYVGFLRPCQVLPLSSPSHCQVPGLMFYIAAFSKRFYCLFACPS